MGASVAAVSMLSVLARMTDHFFHARPLDRGGRTNGNAFRNVLAGANTDFALPCDVTNAPGSVKPRGATPSPQRLPEALKAFEQAWQCRPGRQFPCLWPDVAPDCQGKPARLGIATWHEEVLCGLAVGDARKSYVGADHPEGSLHPGHPLKERVVPEVLTFAAADARVSGRRGIRLMDSLDGMAPRYKALRSCLSLQGESRDTAVIG